MIKYASSSKDQDTTVSLSFLTVVDQTDRQDSDYSTIFSPNAVLLLDTPDVGIVSNY